MSLQRLIENVSNATLTPDLFHRILTLEQKILSSPQLLKELDDEAMPKLLREATRYGLTEITKLVAESENNYLNRLECALLLGDVKLAKLSLRNGERFFPKWDDHHPGDHIFTNENIENQIGMVKVLVEFGLAGYRNKKGDNFLHIFTGFAKKAMEIKLLKSPSLLTFGILINERNHAGCTPLLYSIPSENIPSIKFLIEKGADVNQKSSTTLFSPLTQAAQIMNTEIIDLLLSSGATGVNGGFIHHSGTGSSVLHVACSQNSARTIDCLLRKGAKISAVFEQDKTPFSFLYPDEPYCNESD